VRLLVHAAVRRDRYWSLTGPFPFGPLVEVDLIFPAVQLQLAYVLVREGARSCFSHLSRFDSSATQIAAASPSRPPTMVMIRRIVRTVGKCSGEHALSRGLMCEPYLRCPYGSG
jgi:hypothetical protein